MNRFAADIAIAAPPEAIWRVLADLTAWPTWDPTTDKVMGVVEKDSQLTFAFAYAPGRDVAVTITAIDEPFLLEWTGGNTQFTGIRTHRITPAGEGSRFEISQEFSGSAVNDTQLPDLDKPFAAFCSALKKRVEA